MALTSKGRKSAAALAILAPAAPEFARPEPPKDLTPAEAELWRAIVATKPPDWWGADNRPLLRAYVEAISAMRTVSGDLAGIAAADRATDAGLRRFRTLIEIRSDQARLAASLATRMRLSQQSKMNGRRASTLSSAAPARTPEDDRRAIAELVAARRAEAWQK